VHGLRDEPLDDPRLGAVVADRLELDLAARRRDDRGEVGDPGRPDGLAEPDGPLERRGLEDLEVGDADPDADAGPLADLGRAASEVRELGDDAPVSRVWGGRI
jgi:hypothetical protein